MSLMFKVNNLVKSLSLLSLLPVFSIAQAQESFPVQKLSEEALAMQALAAPDKNCDAFNHLKVADFKDDIKTLRANLLAPYKSPLSTAEVEKLVDTLIDPSLTKKEADGSYTVSVGDRLDFTALPAIYPYSKALLRLSQHYAASPDPYILAVLKETIASLEKRYFHNNAPETGNWWWYEIGISKVIGQSLIILADDLTKEELAYYIFPTKYFQPNPYYSGMSPGAKFSSSPNLRLSLGGNRLDTALVSFYRGILLEDPQEIQCALNSINDTVAIVTEGDGFYEDGSFIQHEVVGYNGTYGKVLLNGFATMKLLTKGTNFVFGNKEVEKLFASFKDSYGYLMINGGVTDAVSGRAVSKFNALYGKSNDKRKVYYNRLDSDSDLGRGQALQKIFESLELSFPEKTDNKYFYSMDKLVHRNLDGGAIVMSMHSPRIANFETMNRDNPFGQLTGDGFMYIYGLNKFANVGYFLDYNFRYAPGVTSLDEDLIPYKGEKRVSKALTTKSFVGGVSLEDNKVFVGFDYENWNKEAEFQKSYIVNDKGVFVAGYTDYKGDKEVITTLDQRRLDYALLENKTDLPLYDQLMAKGLSREEARAKVDVDFATKRKAAPAQVFVDGKAIKENSYFAKAPQEVVFTDKFGTKITYALYNLPNLEIKFENGFVSFISRGTHSFDYGIYPQSKALLNSPYRVLALDSKLQAFQSRDNKETFVNFFAPGSFAGLTVSQPAQVVKVINQDYLDLYVNDPSQTQNTIEVSLEGRYQVVDAEPSYKVLYSNNSTTLHLDINSRGKSSVIKLKAVK